MLARLGLVMKDRIGEVRHGFCPELRRPS
jgi:hypothetical protein